jgi:SAM-dependent methyltransferase
MDLKERGTSQNRHPWELSRADMVLQLLARHARSTRYADIGSGDLYFAQKLADTADARVYAVDVNYPESATNGRVVICTDLNQVPSASIDCAVLMDVLEHVDDDVGLLRAVGRILTAAGELVVTVPAHAFLWSDHDVFLGHRRRYNRDQVRDALQRGGFDIVECFYFYAGPFLARAAGVGLSRLGGEKKEAVGVGQWPYPSTHVVTGTLRAMLNVDFRLSRLLGRTPVSGFGLSICALCRRTSA